VSAIPGWYPDPQGGYGQLRYWDGQAWTPHTTLAPTGPLGGPAEQTVPVAAPDQPGGVAPMADQHGLPGLPGIGRRRRAGPIVAGVAGVLALVLGVGYYVGRPSSSTVAGAQAASAPAATPRGSTGPTAVAPSVDGVSCAPVEPQTVAAQPDPARVSAGGLSYPTPPDPWPAPVTSDFVMPLTASGAVQMVRVAEFRTDGWAAGLMVAELRKDPAFTSVEQAAKVTAGCLAATQYTVASMGRKDRLSRATTIGGRPAWVIEADISLKDPGLTITKELMLLTVVETTAGAYAMFWASIPDVDPDFTSVARACQKGLRVGPTGVTAG